MRLSVSTASINDSLSESEWNLYSFHLGAPSMMEFSTSPHQNILAICFDERRWASNEYEQGIEMKYIDGISNKNSPKT